MPATMPVALEKVDGHTLVARFRAFGHCPEGELPHTFTVYTPAHPGSGAAVTGWFSEWGGRGASPSRPIGASSERDMQVSTYSPYRSPFSCTVSISPLWKSIIYLPASRRAVPPVAEVNSTRLYSEP